MKLYTNTIAAIVAFYRGCIATYHRIVGVSQSEYLALQSRLEALEISAAADYAALKQEVEEKERQIAALESCLTTSLAKQCEAIRWLNSVKRHSQNVIGEIPEVLK